MTSVETPETFGELVRRRLAQLEQTMAWLCQTVATMTNEKRVSVPGLIKWLDRPQRVLPYRVFALERALQLPGGYLSRELGYLPKDVEPLGDVVSSIRNDDRLSDPSKRALIAAYREMVRDVRTKTVQHRTNAS